MGLTFSIVFSFFNVSHLQFEYFAVLACFTFIFVLSKVKNSHGQKQSNQKRLTGPNDYFLGSLVNLVAVSDTRKTLKVLDGWCKKYGAIFNVKFGPKSIVFLNSPKYVQKLLGSTDMGHHRKGRIYGIFRPVWRDGLLISTGDKWKLRRKLVHKSMSSVKMLLNHMEIFNEEADLLVRKLMANEKGVEIEELLNNAIINAILKVISGKRETDFESVDESEIGIKEVITRSKEVAAKRILNPWLLSNFLWKLHPLSKIEKMLSKMAWNKARAILGEELEKEKRVSLKDSLLNGGVTVEGILEETNTLASAGYETTAGALQFLLFLLALHPSHQELCRKEVDSLFGEKGDFLEFRDLDQLKHLEMCVLETLRLFPIVFCIMRRLTAPLKLEKDLELAAGTEVAIYMPGIHKNSNVYPNPDKFIPERFGQEESELRHPYAFIPFSAGPRKCIGYKFAMMEMLCLTAKLLRHYEISTMDTLENIVILPYITLTLEKPIRFVFTRRNLKF